MSLLWYSKKIIGESYGYGEEKRRWLRTAGYDYGLIQKIVNSMLGYKKRQSLDFDYFENQNVLLNYMEFNFSMKTIKNISLIYLIN